MSSSSSNTEQSTSSKFPKLSLHAAPSSLSSLSRPSTPPLSQPIPVSQPPARFATVEQFEQLSAVQADIVKKLSDIACGLASASSSNRRQATNGPSEDEEMSGEELETTVTLGAGRTPISRSIQRSKARRISLEQRAQRVHSTASSANREVLGLSEERLRSTGDYLSAIADHMDEDDDIEEYSADNNTSERKVNTQQHNKSQHNVSKPRLVVVKRDAAASSSTALHPDLFAPKYDEADSVVSLLSKSLSAGVKSKKKFSDKKQLIDLLAKGRDHAIATDGLSQSFVNSSTYAWWQYETYVWQLLIEKGWEAADWYHRQLFERISIGRHDLIKDGPVNGELIRELDRQFMWLNESLLASKKPSSSSSSDRFRSKKSGSNNASAQSKSKQPFTGVPCKFHGPESRHTTADCHKKQPAQSSSTTSSSS
jgi:hypothetical protein